MSPEKGNLVISTAGHDKGLPYIVVGMEDGRYLLADGKRKLLERPKRKKSKHLQVIPEFGKTTLFQNEKAVRDEDIKRIIKAYRRNSLDTIK